MQNFLDQFYLNFIKDDRWKYLTDGLKTTLPLGVILLVFIR